MIKKHRCIVRIPRLGLKTGCWFMWKKNQSLFVCWQISSRNVAKIFINLTFTCFGMFSSKNHNFPIKNRIVYYYEEKFVKKLQHFIIKYAQKKCSNFQKNQYYSFDVIKGFQKIFSGCHILSQPYTWCFRIRDLNSEI